MCTQTHTNICLGAQTHTHAPVCLAEKRLVSVCSLACICRLVALSKFNAHMQTGKHIHADSSRVGGPEMAGRAGEVLLGVISVDPDVGSPV